MKTIDQSELKGFYLFGNKGNVWNNTAHIAGEGSCTLCGTPMLSSNHVRYEGITVAGCQKCIEIWESLQVTNK